MNYCFDIDGVLCSIKGKEYSQYEPNIAVINKINSLYQKGHTIKLFTSRGTKSGIDWEDFTQKQLESWGVSFNELIMGKPDYDVFVDDKAIDGESFLDRHLVVMLIGGKGVGKSTVRAEFEKFGFHPILNETKYLDFGKLYPDKDINMEPTFQDFIYKDITREIVHAAYQYDVVYEATGTNPRWAKLYRDLKTMFNVKVVKVISDPSISAERLKARDTSNNYPFTPEHVAEVSGKIASIHSDFTIDNSGDIKILYEQVERIINESCCC